MRKRTLAGLPHWRILSATILTGLVLLFSSTSIAQNCSNNLLQNHSFEEGTTSWNVLLGKITITTDAHSGRAAVELGGKTGLNAINQSFAGKPNTSYSVRAFVKKNNTTGRHPEVSIKFYNASWQPLITPAAVVEHTGGYEALSFSRTSPPNTAYVGVEFFYRTSSDNQLVFIDNVCLSEEANNPVTPPASCSITAVVAETACYDRGTDDPSDDGYNWTLDATASGGGSGYTVSWLQNGFTKSFNGTYGEQLFVGQNLITLGVLNLTITDNANATCRTTATVTPPAPCSGPQGNGGDLELTATGPASNVSAWSNATTTFTLKNTGSVPSTGIEVDFLIADKATLQGGNEYATSQGTLANFWLKTPTWQVGTLAPNQSVTIDLNVFTLTANEIPIYGQVSDVNEVDPDSSPANGTCCTANEDDEAVFTFNGSNPTTPTPSDLSDLSIQKIFINNAPAAGQVLKYNFNLVNAGPATATGNFNIKAYISTDNVLSSDDIQDGIVPTGNIPVGTINTIPGASRLPTTLPQGDYYLILKVDADNQIPELNEENNTLSERFTSQPTPGGQSCAFVNNFTPQGFAPIGVNYDVELLETGGGYNITYQTPATGFPPASGNIVSGTYQLDAAGNVTNANETARPFERVVSIDRVDTELFFVFDNTGVRVPINYGTLPAGAQGVGAGAVFKTSFGYAFGVFIVTAGGRAINRVVQTNNNGTVLRVDEMPTGGFFSGFNRLTEGPNRGLFAWYATSGNNTLFGIPSQGTLWDYRVLSDTPSADWEDTRISEDGQWVITSKTDNFRAVYGRINLNSGAAQTVDLSDFVNSDTPPNGFRQHWMYGAAPTRDGGILVAVAYRNVTGARETGTFIGKLNANGQTLWRQNFTTTTFFGLSLKPIGETADGGYLFAGTESTDKSLFVKTTNTGELFPTCGGTNPGNGADLELTFPYAGTAPAQWSNFSPTLTLTNAGLQAATNIEVIVKSPEEVVYQGGNEVTISQGSFQWDGDEIWRVGTLAPGATATLNLNYFRLSPNGFFIYTQVIQTGESDLDSTPGNGTCCTANEDDEASLQVGTAVSGRVGTRSDIVENLGNKDFAIVTAAPNPTTGAFNLAVYSNEYQTSEITVVDVLGRSVLHKEVSLNKGHNSILIDLEHVGAGMMMVKMTPFHPYLREIRVMKARD